MNVWKDISADKINAESFYVLTKTFKGSRVKYEFDMESGLMVVDKVFGPMSPYPLNVGVLPRTLSKTEKPLEVLILCSESLPQLTLVQCYPIGVFKIIGQKVSKNVILGIPFKDSTYNGYTDTSELPKVLVDELYAYRHLEVQGEATYEIADMKSATSLIRDSMQRFNEKYGWQ